jgi:FkbM family methyltransferase
MKIFKKIVYLLILLIFKIDRSLKLNDIFYTVISQRKKVIKLDNLSLSFYVPNQLILYRVNTFFSKEPEIIEWINNFKEKGIFYDVGANIGLYSCYASKKMKTKTFSFEPSVFNLENLSKNIYLNNLSDKITIIPNPLYSKKTISEMNMSNTDLGGALSTFKEDYSYDGNKIQSIFKFRVPGVSIDNLIEEYSLPYPDYLKIDVDGIEHLILKGATKSLQQVKSIFIEVNENFYEHKNTIEEILLKNHFEFVSKYSDIAIKSEKFKDCFNQIWSKKKLND